MFNLDGTFCQPADSRKAVKTPAIVGHIQVEGAASGWEEPGGGEGGQHPPLLSPSGPRRIRHSSIWPNAENMTRMSFSLHFFDTMPMNSFLSSTAAEKKKKKKRLSEGRGRPFISYSTTLYRASLFHRDVLKV